MERKLLELMQDVQTAGFRTADGERIITRITADSRQVVPGSLFVCIRGRHTDGHALAAEALRMGAAAVVCERALDLPEAILVPDTREALVRLFAAWYGHPERRLRLVGVTGTNGKTTVSATIHHLLGRAGYRAGLIGTVSNRIGEQPFGADRTTPEPEELYALLAENVRAGCSFVVMECSSQALDQKRLAGLWFERMIFTNLSQDHLDYHPTLEDYYRAKRSAFFQCDRAVVNLDDPIAGRLLGEIPCGALTCSAGQARADFTAQTIERTADAVRFVLTGAGTIGRIEYPMPGAFSVLNAMEAAVCCLSLGIPMEAIERAMPGFPGVPGRMERLDRGEGCRVICDYAHTPDGLEQLLRTYRPLVKGKLWLLFGCGGDRDRAKRPLMGRTAARYADRIVLTSDNPRTEDPMRILEEVLAGIAGSGVSCQVIPDRLEAIKWVLDHARKDDIILLAGKGHERSQLLGDRTVAFDERAIVRRLLQEKGKG